MKYLTFICAFLLVSSPQQAHAGDEGWAAFGGFVGGYLVNEFSHHAHARKGGYRHRAPTTCSSGYRRASYARPVAYAPAVVARPVHIAPAPPPAPCGHWETRKEKYWVQGGYATRNTPCGPRTEWHEGHWATREQRVWVEDTGYGIAPPHQGRDRNGYYP